MNKNLIIAVVLGVLVLLSAVQAFQLNSLKEKAEDGKLGGSGSADSGFAAKSSAGSQQAVPSNLQNLPAMVGGC